MSTRRLGLGRNGLVVGTAMLGVSLFITLTGCVGYVGPDDEGGSVYVAPPAPDVVIFGGDYDRDRDEHSYYRRGYESRHEEHHGERSGGRHEEHEEHEHHR